MEQIPSTLEYVVAGSWYDHIRRCCSQSIVFTPNPQYLKYQHGYQNYARLYGAEHEIHNGHPINQANQRNVHTMCSVSNLWQS